MRIGWLRRTWICWKKTSRQGFGEERKSGGRRKGWGGGRREAGSSRDRYRERVALLTPGRTVMDEGMHTSMLRA
jgi:hypothetical protein